MLGFCRSKIPWRRVAQIGFNLERSLLTAGCCPSGSGASHLLVRSSPLQRTSPQIHVACFSTAVREDGAVLESFRRRAASEVAAALGSAGSPAIAGSSGRLGPVLRRLADEELSASYSDEDPGEGRTQCDVKLRAEIEELLAGVAELEEHQRERMRLKRERSDHLASGFQTTASENQEFASLVVCAVAGIFGVSVHYGFFVIFAAAYVLYRNSTAQVRRQRASSQALQDIGERLREIEQMEVERSAAIRARVQAGTTVQA